MKTIAGIFALLIFYFVPQAQVGIGTTTPQSSAMLDVQSANKGMLVPRVALMSANSAAPVQSPADALLIYNTATAGTGNDAVTPGFYYWSTAATRWFRFNTNPDFGTWGDGITNAAVGGFNPVAPSDGQAGDQFGQSVSISGNYAIAGANHCQIGSNVNQGSAYMYLYNGISWVEQQKLIAGDGAAGDRFGSSVSISGNYAIVGSPQDDEGSNSDQGSAYIFFFNGTTWIEQQKLTASDGATFDIFGRSVSISGNRAIVGAFLDDIGSNSAQGSAYVYVFDGTTWVLQQKLTASDGAVGDQFGENVSLSGNYAIVGAPKDDIGANGSQGSVYIYYSAGISWVQQAKLTASDGGGSDLFGQSVSIAGNYAIIGAPLAPISVNQAQGAAYIFFFNGLNWVEASKLIANDGQMNENFGFSVSISGTYAIVGSAYDVIGSNPGQGSAYVFKKSGNPWSLLQKISNPNGNASDRLGSSCSMDNNRFVIGAVGAGKAFFGKVN